jgi:hypothetical protein
MTELLFSLFSYEVRRKTKNVIHEMVEWIKRTYPNSSGIIYCLSRNDVEKLALTLQKVNFLILHHCSLSFFFFFPSFSHTQLYLCVRCRFYLLDH